MCAPVVAEVPFTTSASMAKHMKLYRVRGDLEALKTYPHPIKVQPNLQAPNSSAEGKMAEDKMVDDEIVDDEMDDDETADDYLDLQLQQQSQNET